MKLTLREKREHLHFGKVEKRGIFPFPLEKKNFYTYIKKEVSFPTSMENTVK